MAASKVTKNAYGVILPSSPNPQAVRPLTVHATPNWILARRLAMHFDFQRSIYSLADRCLSEKATDMIYISVDTLHSSS
ncbi:hypothetical protein VNO77_44210 [Canavalia gladiata]|uniref:Uncharacterized protein n=1 Tax=Canavalia gladiata TaxID=3824 RepID=A0AAN9JXU5_CANGL